VSAGKAVIGQSGGPTAVINRSLVGFIKEAVNHDFDEILGAKHGLAGMLGEDFVDLSNLSESQLYGKQLIMIFVKLITVLDMVLLLGL